MKNFEKLFPSVASTHFTALWKCLLIGIFEVSEFQLLLERQSCEHCIRSSMSETVIHLLGLLLFLSL